MKLLSDLEDWLKELETRLSQEKEPLLKARDAAQVTDILQHYQVPIPPLSTLYFFQQWFCLNGYFNVSTFILNFAHLLYLEELAGHSLTFIYP